jgi:endonuclease/exonuclease/phosphatase (EEP) superfamily protein YafD
MAPPVPNPEEQPRKAWWKREMFGLMRALILLPGTMTALGLAGTLHWRFELFAHFTLVFFWAAALGAVLMALTRHWRWMAVGLVVVLVNGALLFPFYVQEARAASDAPKEKIRLLSMNVLSINHRYEDAIAAIEEADADIVLLQETTPAWCSALAPLREVYPTYLEVPRNDDFGIAIYTRLPGAKAFEVESEQSPVPILAITLDQGLTVYNVHTTPPVNWESARIRDVMLEELAGWTEDHAGPVVIGGDLNITPWSPLYRRFVAASGLRNARMGFGLLPTWPQDRTFPLLPNALRFRPFMPIDHVMLPPDAGVIRCERGPNIGSDHRPLLVEFYLETSPEVKGAAVQAISMCASNSAMTSRFSGSAL